MKTKLHGANLIQAERQRQITKEHWSLRHDQEEHKHKEIAEAAQCCLQSYINGVGGYYPTPADDEWGLGEKHNANPKRLLVIAGALIAAEIDRLMAKRRTSCSIG